MNGFVLGQKTLIFLRYLKLAVDGLYQKPSGLVEKSRIKFLLYNYQISAMKKPLTLVLFISFTLFSCSVVREKKLDKDAEQFLTYFKSALTKSDSEILALFYSGQSEEEILKGVAVLQNKDKLVSTRIRYSEATGKWEDGYLLIDLPVEIVAEGQVMVLKNLTLRL
ncbi:MAG: hypothetical protein ACKOE6_00345, partial [Flammeovirgaceae bacterium]